MLSKNFIHKLKIILLFLILIISISSVSIITYFQNQNIKAKIENKKFRSIEKKDQKILEKKLVGLTNTMFLLKKFLSIVKPADKHKNLVKIAQQFELLIPFRIYPGGRGFVAQFTGGKSYWNQKSDFGHVFVSPIFWEQFWHDWEKVVQKENQDIKTVQPNDPVYYDVLKNTTINDVKRYFFKQFKDWISFINPQNKKNISQLRGFLQNEQISNEIKLVFNKLEKVLENKDLINFFKDKKINNIVKNINVDFVLELWKLWTNVLNPFYQKITQLKNNKLEKINFLKTIFQKNLSSKQNTEFIKLTQEPNIKIDRLFAKLHYFNGANLINSIKDEILKITNFNNINWQDLLLKTINIKNLQIILNLFNVNLIEYLFDANEEKNSNLQPKKYLNDVLNDLLIFFENGLFSNAKKFDFVLNGFIDELENIVKNNPNLEITSGVVKKLLSPDGKPWIYFILNNYIKPKILNYFKWKTKIENFLKISTKIFGNFKIQNLSHIFDNQQTIKDLSAKVNEIKKQFETISKNAETINPKFKKSLIDMIIILKNLLKFLLSDKILNKKVGQEININFWIWTTIGLLYGERKNPVWNDVGEIVKIFAQYLKDNEIIDVIIRFMDLIDIFANTIYEFSKWKAEQGEKIITDESIKNKIFELLGFKEEIIDDNTFIGKFFKIILEIKNKYSKQIENISFLGEAYFEAKIDKFWNMIDPENWIYTIKTEKKIINGYKFTQYTIETENKFLIKSKKYKYRAKINLNSNSEIQIVELKELNN